MFVQLFLAADENTFGAMRSLHSSRMSSTLTFDGLHINYSGHTHGGKACLSFGTAAEVKDFGYTGPAKQLVMTSYHQL